MELPNAPKNDEVDVVITFREHMHTYNWFRARVGSTKVIVDSGKQFRFEIRRIQGDTALIQAIKLTG